MSTSQRFEQAAQYLSTPSNLPEISNDIKLEIYGLYKFVKVGAVPETSRPSIFSYIDRAKWDAWKSVGLEYKEKGKEAAELRYMVIAQGMGWSPAASQHQTSGEAFTAVSEEEPSAEELLERDLVDEERSAGSGGLNVAVSAISKESEESDDNTLHGLAIQGDVDKLTKYLEQHPEEDVNALDEYGYTPLLLASDRGHRPIVDLLLGRGANARLKDEDGLTALDLAREAGHHEIVELLESRSISE